MNQSGFLVGTLLAAFVLFLAARGRLPVYAGVLWGATPSGDTGPPADVEGDPFSSGLKGLRDLFEGRDDLWVKRQERVT